MPAELHGKPVGFGYKNFAELGHHLIHQHPELVAYTQRMAAHLDAWRSRTRVWSSEDPSIRNEATRK